VADEIAKAVFGLLFESSMEAIFIIDRTTGRIVSANVRVADLLSRDVDAVVGMLLEDLSLEPDRDLTLPGHYEDVAFRRADDYPVFVELQVSHVEEPRHGQLAAYMARDTSERRLLEQELVAKHSALHAAHSDLGRAYAQLEETKRELEGRNREIAMLAWRAAVGELVAGIAHHLNNPVGALDSTIRRMTTLAADVPAPHRAELERMLTRVRQIATRIESNVNAIVQASRTATASAPVAHLELPHELAHVLTTFNDRMDDIPTKEQS
jgi:PAS domain-containing protein